MKMNFLRRYFIIRKTDKQIDSQIRLFFIVGLSSTATLLSLLLWHTLQTIKSFF